jgi:hypothetical protein
MKTYELKSIELGVDGTASRHGSEGPQSTMDPHGRGVAVGARRGCDIIRAR